MKKILCCLIFLLLAFNVQVNAEAADLKIGYVDMRKVMMESAQGKEAFKTLDSIEKAKNSIIREKINEIKKLEADMKKQGAVLTPETKRKKTAEYEKLVAEFQMLKRDRDKALQKNEAELFQKILLDVEKLVAGVARKEGYTAVLDKAGVIYMPDEADLTDRVLKIFNGTGKKTEKPAE